MLNKPVTTLFFIVFLSLSFQMLYAYLDRAPDTDEAVYMGVARSITQTGLPFESLQDATPLLSHPPTFCYLVALFFSIFGEGLFVGRLLSTILSLAILILVYRISEESGDRKTALFGTFILAINPAFLYYSHSVYMEITQALFILLSLYLFLEAEKKGELKFLWLSGLFLGVSLITKYSSLVLLVFFLFWFLTKFRLRFLLMKEAYAFILPVLGCLLIWLVFGYALNKEEFFYQLRWWIEGPEWSAYSWRTVSNVTYLKELIGVITPGFLLVFLYALYTWAKRIRKGFKPEVMNLLPLYFFLHILFMFSLPMKDIKYVTPLLPIFALFIASGIKLHMDLKFNLKRIVIAVLLCIVVFSLSPISMMWDPTTGRAHPNLWLFAIKRDYQYRTYKDIGLFLKTRLNTTDAFLCTNKAAIIRYYADTRYMNAWGAPIHEILEGINRASALVFEDNLPYLSDWEIEQLRKAASEQFVLEKTFLRKDGKRFWIYLRKSI